MSPKQEDTSGHSQDGSLSNDYPRLWRSCRLTYTLCAFIGLVNMILIRYSLALTLICMVNEPGRESGRFVVPLSDTTNVDNVGNWSNIDMSEAQLRLFRETDMENRSLQNREFTWEKDVQGRLNAAIFYGFISTQSFAGYFCDRYGGKLLFVIGTTMQGVCSLFCPLAARLHVDVFFGLRILQGCFCGFVIPSMFALFSKWAPKRERTLLMGFAYSGFPFGNILIYPLSGALCHTGIDGGWPMLFYTTGVVGVCLGICFYFLIYNDPNSHPRISEKEKAYLNEHINTTIKKKIKTPWCAMLKSVPVYAYNVAHFTQSWSFITLASSLPMMLKDMLNLDLSSNGLLSSLPYICSYITRFAISICFGPVLRRSKLGLTKLRKVNHLLGTLIPAISLLCIGLLSPEDKSWAIFLISICTMFTDVGFTGSYLMSYLEIAPPFASFLTGFSNTLGSTPGCISNILTGYLTTHSTKAEWMVVIYIMSSMYVVGGVVYAIFGSSELQPWAEDVD